jgi:hypothetical protein
MNANESSLKATPRLNRIKEASSIFQWLVGLSWLFCLYWLLCIFFGWPNHKFKIVISDSHIYNSPSDMPPEIFALFLVKTGLGIAASVILFALFRLYKQGILFSAKNVLFIRLLGYCLIVNWAIDYLMQSTLRDMDLSMNPVFVGLIIIFIAWVMDEGRKIREEQELTV